MQTLHCPDNSPTDGSWGPAPPHPPAALLCPRRLSGCREAAGQPAWRPGLGPQPPVRVRVQPSGDAVVLETELSGSPWLPPFNQQETDGELTQLGTASLAPPVSVSPRPARSRGSRPSTLPVHQLGLEGPTLPQVPKTGTWPSVGRHGVSPGLAGPHRESNPGQEALPGGGSGWTEAMAQPGEPRPRLPPPEWMAPALRGEERGLEAKGGPGGDRLPVSPL